MVVTVVEGSAVVLKETVEFIVMNFTPAGKALQMGMKTAETALKMIALQTELTK